MPQQRSPPLTAIGWLRRVPPLPVGGIRHLAGVSAAHSGIVHALDLEVWSQIQILLPLCLSASLRADHVSEGRRGVPRFRARSSLVDCQRCWERVSESATTWFPIASQHSTTPPSPRIWWSSVRADRPLLDFQQDPEAYKLARSERTAAAHLEAAIARAPVTWTLSVRGDVLSHSGVLFESGSGEEDITVLIHRVLARASARAGGI